MVFVGGRTSWTLIKWSTSLRINSSLVGAEIGTLQVAPASAQQIDGMVITSSRIWILGVIVALMPEPTQGALALTGTGLEGEASGRASAREVPGAVDDA